MKKIFDNEAFSFTRLLLPLVVLTAIIFSNGEGISLLPFSDFDSQTEISFKKSAEKKFNSYVFSVHGSGNLRNSLVSKSQKNLKFLSLSPSFSIFCPQNILERNLPIQKQNYNEDKIFASSGILSKPVGRAPPAI